MKDVKLFMGIIKSAKEKFIDLNPMGSFEIIFWDDLQHVHNNGHLSYILNDLKSMNVKFHLISDIINKYNERKNDYIIPHDGHPNKLSYQIVSDYIVENILTKSHRSSNLGGKSEIAFSSRYE